MCGIGGRLNLVAGPPPTLAALRRMAASIFHRGPDELGLYRDDELGFVHTRLSIIDLVSGQQPMANADDTLQLVFNGEIFNFVELREELRALGHRFRTKSDTEVILHAFERWGVGCFERFNGQFALAIWDRPNRRLTLARDRFGVRPLHYTSHGGVLTFASEVKAIYAADAAIPRGFDPVGLQQVFTFWSPLAPRTPFEGISEVPPGHVMTVEGGELRTAPFWLARFPTDRSEEFPGTVDEAADAVRDALLEATRLRVLRADVPVGSYLSGGLDSSLIAALASGQRAGRLSTFSLRFADAEYDETEYQQMMVERLGSDHHEVVVSRSDIAAAFPRVVAHAERPLLRTAPAPLYLLSELVNQNGIKVVLTGEGADEMFGGYDLFREGKVRRWWGQRPESTMRPLLLQRLYPYLARSPVRQRSLAQRFFGQGIEQHAEVAFAHHPRWRTTAALQRMFSASLSAQVADTDVVAELLDAVPAEIGRWSPLAQDQYLEIRTLLSSYLLCSQGDRMLMAHSVEGRFPFLDVNVAALAATLPPRYKLRALDEKHILKRLAADLLPPDITRRTKQPYRAPDALCFVDDAARSWVTDLVSPGAVGAVGVFDAPTVTALWNKVVARRDADQLSNTDNMALVGVISTQLLHTELFDGTVADGDDLWFKTLVDRCSSKDTVPA